VAEPAEKPSGITDESIESMVAMVEAAESLGKPLGLSASQAVRLMLQSTKIMGDLHRGKATLALKAMATGVGIQ
jgi:hypothetical protein